MRRVLVVEVSPPFGGSGDAVERDQGRFDQLAHSRSPPRLVDLVVTGRPAAGGRPEPTRVGQPCPVRPVPEERVPRRRQALRRAPAGVWRRHQRRRRGRRTDAVHAQTGRLQATPGYDDVTGLGSPTGDLIPDYLLSRLPARPPIRRGVMPPRGAGAARGERDARGDATATGRGPSAGPAGIRVGPARASCSQKRRGGWRERLAHTRRPRLGTCPPGVGPVLCRPRTRPRSRLTWTCSHGISPLPVHADEHMGQRCLHRGAPGRGGGVRSATR